MIGRGLIDRLDDGINPIVVKELRQAVKSNFVVAVLLLFLGLQMLATGIYLMFATSRDVYATPYSQSGYYLFMILHGVMLATTMLFLPLYIGIRLWAERSDSQADLLFVSTLSARAIVGGKFLAALVVAMIIFSACTPFLFFTYFLRGIDAPSIVFVVALDFVAVAFAVMAAIFVAVIPVHWIVKAALGVLGFVALLILLYLVLGLTFFLLAETGVGSMMEVRDFWGATCCALTAVLGSCALLYSWAAALLSPPTANRALLPRLVLVGVWSVGLAMAWTWNGLLPRAANGPLINWAVLATALVCLSTAIAISERESWSLRVARTIPRRWWLRCGAFFFYSGAAGGLAYSMMLFAATLGATVLGVAWFDDWQQAMEGNRNQFGLATVVGCMMVAWFYVLGYALTALVFRRLLASRIPIGATWVVMLLLMALGSTVPLVPMVLFYRDWNYASHYPTMLTNPFVAIAEMAGPRAGAAGFFLAAGSVWAAVAAMVNLPWFLRQVRAFRPHQSIPGGSAEMALPVALIAAQAATTKTDPTRLAGS